MNAKQSLIDVLFELQKEYDFDLTFTTDKEYILRPRK